MASKTPIMLPPEMSGSMTTRDLTLEEKKKEEEYLQMIGDLVNQKCILTKLSKDELKKYIKDDKPSTNRIFIITDG